MGEFPEAVEFRPQKKLYNPSDFGKLGLTILVFIPKPANKEIKVGRRKNKVRMNRI